MSKPNPLVPCPVCATLFRQSRSAKAKKTCGNRECSRELMRRNKPNRKRVSTPQASRGRARALLAPTACAKCGASGTLLDVHHRDGNPYNNRSDNLEALCRNCHAKEHWQRQIAKHGEGAARNRMRDLARMPKKRRLTTYCSRGHDRVPEITRIQVRRGRPTRVCLVCAAIRAGRHERAAELVRLTAQRGFRREAA